MDLIEIDQVIEVNMEKKEKKKEMMTEVGNSKPVGVAIVRNAKKN